MPICSKKNGPHDAKNNPQGILQGRYYIRVPGPKSVAIETPEQWRDLIHRCVINERENLLTSINKLLREPASPTQPTPPRLQDWHDETRQQYLEILNTTNLSWPVSIVNNHYQFSYRIIERDGETKQDINGFREAMRVANEAVKNVVWTGWSMFYQFSRPAIMPKILIDDRADTEIEFFETNLLGETFDPTTVPDFWRVTLDGRATIIRPYREDRTPVPHLEKQGLQPGMWLSPSTLIREVYEVATHAKELAKAFNFAEGVEFRCSWHGLKGRRFAEYDPSVLWYDRVCHANSRTTTATFPVEQLAADTPLVVTELAGPVGRLFDGFEITREWVEKLVPSFRML